MRLSSQAVLVVFGLSALAVGQACSSPKSGDKDTGGSGGVEGSDGALTDTVTGGDLGPSAGGDTQVTPTGDGQGSDVPEVPCEPACVFPQQCVGGTCLDSQVCEPGGWYCNGLTAKKQCNEAGTAFLEVQDCPGDQYCSAGQCGLKCSLDPKWGAYVGCVFWAVDLPTWDDPTLPAAKNLAAAVVVSNPSELPATVAFTAPPGKTFNFPDLVIPGLGSKVFEFPSFIISGSSITDFGIRLQSDRPVLVHQFNPWDNTFSNDASLLLPEPLLGQEH